MYLDNFLFAGYWVALVSVSYKLRLVKDDLGENESIRKALQISMGVLSTLVIVEIGTLDGIWVGPCHAA